MQYAATFGHRVWLRPQDRDLGSGQRVPPQLDRLCENLGPVARPVVLARRRPVSPGTFAGAPATAEVVCSVVAEVPHTGTGAKVSICTVIVRNVGNTPLPGEVAG